MSEVGNIPNPLNPADDPKKNTHRLDANPFREKFDYRKKEEASSGKNRQYYAPEEEQTPKTAKMPTPDSIFKSTNPRKSSFQVQKKVAASSKKTPPSSKKERAKKNPEKIAVEKQLERKSIQKEKAPLAPPPPEAPPAKSSKTSLSKPTPSFAKPKEKKKEEPPASFESLANIQPHQPNYQPPVLPRGAAFSSYQISQLFDRMVGVMTVMDLSGITTTELTLSGEEFAASVFYGARITITEHNTAPKVFNIQLSAHPEAVALFQGNMPNLLANFANANYAFHIHRLETKIEERPLFKRKKPFENDQQSMQGDS